MNENKEVFQQMEDNKNVLHITELLLITLFFNEHYIECLAG